MKSSKCSQAGCEVEVDEENDKCVLHCNKDNEYKWHEHKPFYDALVKELSSKNRENVLVLNFIIFPRHDARDDFDYEKILIEFTSIHFNYCEFHTPYLELQRDKTKCFFQDCIFHNYWTLYNYNILTNQDDVLYQACIFQEDVTNYSYIDTKEKYSLYNTSQFDYTCRFEKELNLNNVKLKKPLFYSAQNNALKEKNFINKLILENCTFEQPFKLNNYEITSFNCGSTVFRNKSKFEFKNNIVNSFQVSNTNFKVLVDCYQTEFEIFTVEKSIFEKFTGFEQCEFGEENKEKEITSFQYATFLDFVNFREAKFYNGLDLQNTNLKEYPNFLDIYVEPKNTNRETFRVIKHSFDKVGNIIEANKFFAYEMNKERQDLSTKDNLNKQIMLNLNYWISNFGQSWLRPLGLIVFIAMIHTYLVYAIDNKIFQFINPSNPVYDMLNSIVNFFDDLAKNILPFKKLLKEGMEFISLIFLIIYSTLIYNFVVAVKRTVKR